MKNFGKITSLICLVLSCLIFLSNEESNAQVKKMSSKEMTEASTAVLYGKCKDVKSEWNDDRSAIYTYVTISPEEYIKGNLGQEVVVAVPGGRVGDILYEVSETPFFTVDEDVVAFIWTSPKGKNYITGGFQGKMKIEKDEKTGTRFVEDADETGVNVVEEQGNQIRNKKVELGEFVTKLKGYLKY